jgi:hypothetical protein
MNRQDSSSICVQFISISSHDIYSLPLPLTDTCDSLRVLVIPEAKYTAQYIDALPRSTVLRSMIGLVGNRLRRTIRSGPTRQCSVNVLGRHDIESIHTVWYFQPLTFRVYSGYLWRAPHAPTLIVKSRRSLRAESLYYYWVGILNLLGL